MKKIFIFVKFIITFNLAKRSGIFTKYKQKYGINKLVNKIHLYGIDKNQIFKLTTKQEWIQNFKNYNIVHININEALNLSSTNFQISPELKISVGLSTGTSGHSTPFISTESDRINWFSALYPRVFSFPFFRMKKIAFFLKYDNSLYTDASKSSIIVIKYFNASIPIEEQLQSLVDYSPETVVAPAQILIKISKYYSNFPNLTEMVSVTEKLDEQDKLQIKSKNNIKLNQIYQATEGFLGATCKYGNIHLNEDILVIEKYRLNDNPSLFIPVITDFSREGQLIVRRILDDILEEVKIPCPCKSKFMSIKNIDSRLNDIIIIPYKESFDLLSSRLLNDVFSIKLDKNNDYRLLQTKINEIIITTKYSISIDLKVEIERNILLLIRDKLSKDNLKILWETGFIENYTFIKLRRIQSLVKRSLELNNENKNGITLFPDASKIIENIKTSKSLPVMYLKVCNN